MKRIVYGVICCFCISMLVGVLFEKTKQASAATKETKIEISTNEIGLEATAKITMTNLPRQATCTYSSSNKKVATVSSNGTVKGIAVGKATITCNVKTTVKSKQVTTSYTVEVEVKQPYLEETSGEVIYGETLNLDITCKPKGATYTWKTSDKTVARVSKKGVITPVSEGEATITCVVSLKKQKQILTYTLRVVKTEFESSELFIVLGEEQKLTFLYEPSKAKYSYKSSDETVVSVTEDGVITGISFGEAKITCQMKIGKRKVTSECKIHVGKATLSKQHITLEEGMTAKLSICPTSNRDQYEWRCDDTNIATVRQDGLITGVTPGTTRVTCQVTFQQITYELDAEVCVTQKQKTEEEQNPTTGGETKPDEGTEGPNDETTQRVSGTNEYIYDALHRLVKVIYADGTCVEYTYDANGNITEIRRT